MAELLLDCLYQRHPEQGPSPEEASSIRKLTFSQLRERLIDLSPLDSIHLQRVNQAEAGYWQAMTGSRLDDSTAILGFDCGGEQLVYEIVISIDSLSKSSYRDLDLVQKLLALIAASSLPAPCPIEQRWSARSTAPMSPVYSQHPHEVFSWIGVIMYLPPNQSPEQRSVIQEAFQGYIQAMQSLVEEYDAQVHWAKIEIPMKEENVLEVMRRRVQARYPIRVYNAYRQALDPKDVLTNDMIHRLFDDY
jgi:L-galactono-1,4-lactone dehydrogenase